MKKEWHTAGDYSVEIWFRIEKDKDGYPTSKNWEQLLARPLLTTIVQFGTKPGVTANLTPKALHPCSRW
jgi:hypothetical protein